MARTVEECGRCHTFYHGSACPRCVAQQFGEAIKSDVNAGRGLEEIRQALVEANRWLSSIHSRLGWFMFWFLFLAALVSGCRVFTF